MQLVYLIKFRSHSQWSKQQLVLSPRFLYKNVHKFIRHLLLAVFNMADLVTCFEVARIHTIPT